MEHDPYGSSNGYGNVIISNNGYTTTTTANQNNWQTVAHHQQQQAYEVAEAGTIYEYDYNGNQIVEHHPSHTTAHVLSQNHGHYHTTTGDAGVGDRGGYASVHVTNGGGGQYEVYTTTTAAQLAAQQQQQQQSQQTFVTTANTQQHAVEQQQRQRQQIIITNDPQRNHEQFHVQQQVIFDQLGGHHEVATTAKEVPLNVDLVAQEFQQLQAQQQQLYEGYPATTSGRIHHQQQHLDAVVGQQQGGLEYVSSSRHGGILITNAAPGNRNEIGLSGGNIGLVQEYVNQHDGGGNQESYHTIEPQQRVVYQQQQQFDGTSNYTISAPSTADAVYQQQQHQQIIYTDQYGNQQTAMSAAPTSARQYIQNHSSPGVGSIYSASNNAIIGQSQSHSHSLQILEGQQQEEQQQQYNKQSQMYTNDALRKQILELRAKANLEMENLENRTQQLENVNPRAQEELIEKLRHNRSHQNIALGIRNSEMEEARNNVLRNMRLREIDHQPTVHHHNHSATLANSVFQAQNETGDSNINFAEGKVKQKGPMLQEQYELEGSKARQINVDKQENNSSDMKDPSITLQAFQQGEKRHFPFKSEDGSSHEQNQKLALAKDMTSSDSSVPYRTSLAAVDSNRAIPLFLTKNLTCVVSPPPRNPNIEVDSWWPSAKELEGERQVKELPSDKAADKPKIMLQKLPHCKIHNLKLQQNGGKLFKKDEKNVPMFCWQVTELYPTEAMVCCSICHTWRHACCGGHYKYEGYSTIPTDKPSEFEAVCDVCHKEKELHAKLSSEEKEQLEETRLKHLRRVCAMNEIARQATFSKYGGTYKWPIGGVSKTHINGHTRSVVGRQEKAAKLLSEMVAKLGNGVGGATRVKERTKIRAKEFERLSNFFEDAEGFTNRHNMKLFLHMDTATDKPVGYEKERKNFFDPADFSSDDENIDGSSDTEDGSSSDNNEVKKVTIGDDENSSKRKIEETFDAIKCEVCVRNGCTKKARFDSAYCSDGCGIHVVEKHLLKTLEYAEDIHPALLKKII